MNNVAAYLLAGGFLLIINEFSPGIAVGTMGVIVLGIALTNPNSISTLAKAFKGATS